MEDYLLLDKQVCFALYSASNAVSRAYRPLLQALDLTYLQYIVMLVLWEENQLNVKAIGIRLHMDSGTLTPLLKRLEGKALVQRQRCERDERVVEIQLTKLGIALKQKATMIPEQLACKVGMSEAEATLLRERCEQIITDLSTF